MYLFRKQLTAAVSVLFIYILWKIVHHSLHLKYHWEQLKQNRFGSSIDILELIRYLFFMVIAWNCQVFFINVLDIFRYVSHNRYVSQEN